MNKKIRKPAVSLIKDCLHGQKKYIFSACIISSIMSVSYIVLALLSKEILDIATGEKNGSFLVCTVVLIAVILLQLILNAIESHTITAAKGKMGIYLKQRMFKSLSEKKYCKVSLFHSGELLNRFISDSDVIVQTSVSIVPSIVATITKLAFGSAALLILDWRFAGGLILLGVAVPLLARLISTKYKHLHKAYQKSLGEVKAFFSEMFKNLPVVKSFTSPFPLRDKLSVLLKKQYKITIKRNLLSILSSSGFYLLSTAGYFLALLWGAMGIKKGIVTYGSLIAFLQILSQLRAPMQAVSSFLPSFYSMTASAERLCEIEELEDELHPVSDDVLAAIKDVFKEIRADNLSFHYENEEILKDCSFCAKRGEITVLSGESGGGKSTLFRLLLGYFDLNEGSLSFDNKYDINASTRKLFAYVPQGNMMLSGSIRENIALCNPNCTNDQIESAIYTAALDEWIATLPKGLDTVIGENALGISEGQAQRIAVARALLCETPVLLLDEATSALDHETEEKLLHRLKALNDKTILLVTHRTLGPALCDKHYFLEYGKLKEI